MRSRKEHGIYICPQFTISLLLYPAFKKCTSPGVSWPWTKGLNAADSGCVPTLPPWRSKLRAPLPPLDSNTTEVTTAVLNVSIVNCFTAVQDRHCRLSLLCWHVKDTVAKTTRFKASHCSGISLAQHLLLRRSSKPKVWHPDLIRTVQNQFI